MVYGSGPRSPSLCMSPQIHLLGRGVPYVINGMLKLGVLRGLPNGTQLCGVNLIGERFRGDGTRGLWEGCLSSMRHEDLAWGLIQLQRVGPSNGASEPGMRGTLKPMSKGPARRDVWGGGNSREHTGDESPNNPTCSSPHSQGSIPWFPEPLSIKGLTVPPLVGVVVGWGD